MAYDTLKCPKCEYENIVLTCGFCIQCGNDLSDLIDTDTCSIATSFETSETTATNNSNTAVKTDVSPPPKLSLESLVEEAAQLIGAQSTTNENGWRLTLPVANDRRQNVHVLRGSEQEGTELLSFLSICGDAASQNAMAFLEWNSRLTGCAFAVRQIGGKPMFVLSANWPKHLLDVSLIAETVQKVAKRADQVEAKLSPDGKDRY